MTEHYPRIRIHKLFDDGRTLFIRESVGITFYLRHPHRDIAQEVWRAIEMYRRAVGPQRLQWYPDAEGDWQELDEQGWAFSRRKVLERDGGNTCLVENHEDVTGYEVQYYGVVFDDPMWPVGPNATSTISFFLPTEHLEEYGPGWVRELAVDLSRVLPFDSGHAGLTFLFPEESISTTSSIRDDSFRYPGLDIPDSYIARAMGSQVKGVHWMNFLGSPILEALGGIEGLRARLHSPGTTVQPLEGGKTLVTLGEWPEAGDLEQGHTLPAYRELARVLEPWFFGTSTVWRGFSPEDMRRWLRRFLDQPLLWRPNR